MVDKYTNISALTEFLSKIKAWANAQFATKAVATTSADGLLSSTDKTKLNGIATGATAVSESTVSGWGFTKNTGTITGVKMNGASKGTSGVVDLGTVITAHQDISGKADKADLATVATSGSYNDLSNKPTIPAAVAVKGDAESTYRTGNVNLTKANIGLGNVGNFKAVSTVASQGLTDTEKANARTNIGAGTSSFSGSYNDLSNKPTIPAEVTESTVSGWGFTKNTGTVTSIKIQGTSPIVSSSSSAITSSGTRTISHADSGATAGSYGDSAAQTPAYGGTFKVPYVTVNATGHVTSISEHNVTIPASDNTDHRKSFYATCTTAADAQKKVATLANSDGWELKAGTVVGVKFTNTNTYDSTAAAPVTLNVNSTGDKPIYYNNAASPTGTNTGIYGYANRIIYYMYDGTNWCWLSDGRHDGNSDTKVRQTLKTDNVNRPLLMAYSDNTVTTDNVDNVSYRNNSIYANASTGNIQATKLNGVDIGSSPKFTDTTYSAEKGISLSSGKFGHSNTAITAQTTQAVYPIKIDAYGHITAYGSAVTSMTPSSHTHGNIQNGGTLQTNDITIASGDKLVVTDSSDSSKIARSSISFDGSTTTKFLSKKGTWEDAGGNVLQMDLLWENASPSSDFTAQTVSLNMNYSSFLLAINLYNSSDGKNICSFLTKNLSNMRGVVCGTTSGTHVNREYVILSNGIKFVTGKANNSGNNGACVPYQIYGIK